MAPRSLDDPSPGAGPASAAEPPPAEGPLAGLRVVDCSTVLAGPYCTMVLGDLGADVIKVEPPEGDASRGWGPPWVGDPGDGTRTAAYYLAINRNKRSLRLDLSGDEGRAVLRELLRRGDVVVENHRVGGFERLGFSDAVLDQLNPGLVHLAISGFGVDGPDASKPGYDFVIQAVAGLMSITGAPDGPPTKVGVAISDVVTGLFGAISILAALVARGSVAHRPAAADAEPAARADRGPAAGQRIDLSLLESTLAILINQAQNAFVSGRAPGRLGNAHPNIVPYQAFRTADGEIAVAVGSERQWQRFCEALELAGLATDGRYATNAERVVNRDGLVATLQATFLEGATAEWLRRLDLAGVPAGPILDVLDAFESPQAVARGSRVPVRHERLGAVDQVSIPFTLSETPAGIRRPPPLLGEHSREILGELGYAPDAIDGLVARRVV
ncbi:MAG TPA: CaiB/BaiF CoA-transferase family protein [Candidatus Limnocylindrales bacterium]|nr:CaiB/BaiF CoA-transferase family protein [Candidatus Limnocylindrales bacterium]